MQQEIIKIKNKYLELVSALEQNYIKFSIYQDGEDTLLTRFYLSKEDNSMEFMCDFAMIDEWYKDRPYQERFIEFNKVAQNKFNYVELPFIDCRTEKEHELEIEIEY